MFPEMQFGMPRMRHPMGSGCIIAGEWTRPTNVHLVIIQSASSYLADKMNYLDGEGV